MSNRSARRNKVMWLIAIGVMSPLLPVPGLAQNYVFGPNVRVNDDPAGTSEHILLSPGQRMIAARGDTVYVTWEDSRDYRHAYFARSVDGGLSFGPNIRLDSGIGWPSPSLVIDDNGVIHICMLQCEIVDSSYIAYTKSTDGGQHFSVPVVASESSMWLSAGSIAASRNGQRIYVAVSPDWPRSDVILNRSSDGGRTFMRTGVRVNDDTTRAAYDAAIAVFDDTIVLVAWDNYEWPGYGIGIHFARSTDGGATFGPSVLLNDTSGGDSIRIYNPSMGVDSAGRVVVVYFNDQYPQAGLRLAVSDDTGRTFHHERAVRFGGWPTSLWVLPNGQLFVAFADGGTDDIGFTYSPNCGDTFFPWVSPVRGGGSFLMDPTVAANRSGQAFIAWEDSRNNGYADIYFATGAMSAISDQPEAGDKVAAIRVLTNPSRAPVQVELASNVACTSEADLFDLTGRLIRRLRGCHSARGVFSFTWDGTADGSEPAPSGIYFVRVKTLEGQASVKIQYLSN